MSAGNLNTPNGKKNNFTYQFNVLRLLGAIQGNTDQVETILQDIENNTDNVEPLLSQILATLQINKDYEAFFVQDDNNVTWLEVRIFNTGPGTWDPSTYYLPGSLIPGSPVLPLTYVSPNSLLAQILSESVGQTSLLTSIDTILNNLTFTGSDLDVSSNIQVGDVDVSALNPVPVTFASSVQTTSVQRIASSGPGATIPAGAFEVSFFNAGSIINTIHGVTLLPTEKIVFRADTGKTLNAIPYSSPVGSDLLITVII